jgi:hypothetical protein
MSVSIFTPKAFSIRYVGSGVRVHKRAAEGGSLAGEAEGGSEAGAGERVPISLRPGAERRAGRRG